MAQADLYNVSGKKVGTVDLNDGIFGVEVNEHVMHMAVVAYLANQRQGTKGSKTRAEVSGGGIKPRPQKGSGRSRQGSIRSPQWVGGGVVFAPKARDYSMKINKKIKRLALKSALSSRLASNELIVIDELKMADVKTKEMQKILNNLGASRSLVIIEGNDQNLVLSIRNIEFAKMSAADSISTYDILKYDKILVTKAAVEKIQEVYA